MEAMFPVLFPMLWIFVRVSPNSDFLTQRQTSRVLLALVGLLTSSLAFGAALQRGDSVRTSVLLNGLEGRPIVVSEVLPLSGVASTVKAGVVDMEGQVELEWPDDGALRFFRVDCAGSTWTLPVVKELPEGTVLIPAPPGRAPFSQRPGMIKLGSGPGDRSAERLALFTSGLEELELDVAIKWQRHWLIGNVARGGEAEILGGRIGETPEEQWVSSKEDNRGRMQLDSLFVEACDGAEPALAAYLDAMRWRTALDLPQTNLDSARFDWQSRSAPSSDSPAEVLRFAEGSLRFAKVDSWPDTLTQRHKRALAEGDFAALVSTTSHWWGRRNEAKTEAWLVLRFGMDGFGVRSAAAPFVGRLWPPGLVALLDELEQRPEVGEEVGALRMSWNGSGVLPSDLRGFNQREDLIRMADLVGSGPGLWLWIDASSPSTTVQLQVLERMIGTMRKGPRDLTFVVADAGSDWAAFQALYRDVVQRAGGIKRIPFEMLHTGADIRWTMAFDLAALPSVRHHGPDFRPTPEALPLPGPELSGWLSRRP